MPNPLIVSASDDEYLDLLDGMLASIGGRLADFDLGIIDLGLSDAGKDRIRARKTDVHFARAEWRRTFPGIDKASEYKKVFVSKPFIPDIFPGYENYVWVDADIWFQDAGAIDDYVEAGNTRGGGGGFKIFEKLVPANQFSGIHFTMTIPCFSDNNTSETTPTTSTGDPPPTVTSHTGDILLP